MRFTTALLVGTSALAVAMPAVAQSTQEQQAQQANPPSNAPATTTSPEGEIIVTATKRRSTVQDVPFSVNAQTQQDIERSNATTIEDLSRNVAGLAVQNLGPGQSQVSIRGVSAGQIVRDQPGVKEQVGVYLDESVISLSLFTPDLDLFDLNRVETLRGPQGTLFGSGSMGGTVRYITNQPKLDRVEGEVEGNVNVAKGGDFGYHLKGAINIPLGPTAAARAVAYDTHYPGFIDAIGPAAGKNVNDGDRRGGRFSVLWQPASNIRLTPRIVYQKVSANGFNREEVFNLFANPFTNPPHVYDEREQYLLKREKFVDKTRILDLVGSVDFGGIELTSVTSQTHRDILVSRDASALTHSISLDFGLPAAVASIPSELRDTTKLNQFTQELRLASTGTGPFQWVVGGFYSNVKRDYLQRLPTPGYDVYLNALFVNACTGPADSAQASFCAVNAPLPANRVPLTTADVANGFPLDSPYNSSLAYKINQKALFGEATYDFGQFKLTAGGRYYKFDEKRNFISGGIFANGDNLIGQTTKSHGVSPRFIATYEPSRNLSFNVQAAKGFRLGGVNDPINLNLCTAEDRAVFSPFVGAFDDESLWNYEAGVKYSKGGVTFNAAAYHTQIRDLQVTLDAGSCSSRLVFNVPKAHTTGLEAEFSARPMRGVDLSLAASLVSSEFDSTLPGTLAETTGIRKGNRLPSVPRYQIAATATYTTRPISNADWYTTASVQRIGSRYTQPADQENNPRTFVSGLAFNGAPGTNPFVLDLKLPAYTLVNLSTGLAFDSGLEIQAYVNNLFDKDPRLSFDRERGGRARLGFNVGLPRIIGLTVRQKFGHSTLAPAPVVVAPLPPPPPATQTCPDGSVIAADAVCAAPPPPPPPAPVERGQRG